MSHACSRDETWSICSVCVVAHCAHLYILLEWVFCSQNLCSVLGTCRKKQFNLSTDQHHSRVVKLQDMNPNRTCPRFSFSTKTCQPISFNANSHWRHQRNTQHFWTTKRLVVLDTVFSRNILLSSLNIRKSSVAIRTVSLAFPCQNSRRKHTWTTTSSCAHHFLSRCSCHLTA